MKHRDTCRTSTASTFMSRAAMKPGSGNDSGMKPTPCAITFLLQILATQRCRDIRFACGISSPVQLLSYEISKGGRSDFQSKSQLCNALPKRPKEFEWLKFDRLYINVLIHCQIGRSVGCVHKAPLNSRIGCPTKTIILGWLTVLSFNW